MSATDMGSRWGGEVGECAWTPISPLHPEHPLKPWAFASAALWLLAGGMASSLVASELAAIVRRRGGRSSASPPASSLLCGGAEGLQGATKGRGGRRRSRAIRRALLACLVLMLLSGAFQLIAWHGRGLKSHLPASPPPPHLFSGGGPARAPTGGGKAGGEARRKPKVVVMMPTRKDLHPLVTKKAFACLDAMMGANPDLDLEVFLFDRVVSRIAADKRPLSKVSRIRNMMIEEAGVGHKYDYTLWLDSDIIEYPADLPTRLIRENPDGITAPLVLIEEPGPLGTDQFYDTTAFVKRHRSNVSDDTCPFVAGRNVDRFYPYVLPAHGRDAECGGGGGEAATPRDLSGGGRRDWWCAMLAVQELDSVGTIYMVSADIFREGKAVFADHPSFTEHYPLMEQAWRMGRRVVVSTRTVARHANLPFYGENFHANVILGVGDEFPAKLKQARPDEMASWMRQITSAYCKELGRLPDPGGMLSYMQHLQRGVAYLEGNEVVADEAFVRATLAGSGEAKALVGREMAGAGRMKVGVNFSSVPARQHDLFSVSVACTGGGCAGASNLIYGDECSANPRCDACLDTFRAGKHEGSTRQIGLTVIAAVNETRGGDVVWAAAEEGVLMGYPYAQLLGEEARFERSLSFSRSGVYRLVASLAGMGTKGGGADEAMSVSSTFLVVPGEGPWEGRAGGGGVVVEEERAYVVFAHSSARSKASDHQLITAVDQAIDVHRGWRVRVYMDDSASDFLLSKLTQRGAEVVNAESMLSDAGEFTWAFWPFLAADDASVSRFLVREAGFDVIERERAAVREWAMSHRQLHVARDSSFHDRPFNPRAWGCMKPCNSGQIREVGGMKRAVESFLALHGAAVRTDFWFGDSLVWPSFADTHQALAHDSYSSSLPFPTRREGTDHVAQLSKSWMQGIATADGTDGAERREWDAAREYEELMNADKPEWTCQRAPHECRKHIEWTQG